MNIIPSIGNDGTVVKVSLVGAMDTVVDSSAGVVSVVASFVVVS